MESRPRIFHMTMGCVAEVGLYWTCLFFPRAVFLQFVNQNGCNLARFLETLDGNLAYGVEVEAVFQACFPEAVLLALLYATCDLEQAFSLAAGLYCLGNQSDNSKVFQRQRIGQQLGFVEHRRAVGH